MEAIARAAQAPGSRYRVVRVIADRPTAGGLARAAALVCPTSVVPVKEFADRTAFEAALGAEIEASGAALVALAGFMRILSPQFVQRFEGRLLNIHPSLLPTYKGLDTHARVLAARDTHHGASVHFVTAELDGGPVVMQGRLRVQAGDTPDSISARVHALEHIIYPHVCSLIAAGASNGARDRYIATASPSPPRSSRKTMRLPEITCLLALAAGVRRAADPVDLKPFRATTAPSGKASTAERHARAQAHNGDDVPLLFRQQAARHVPHGAAGRDHAGRPSASSTARGADRVPRQRRKGTAHRAQLRLEPQTRHGRRQGQDRRPRAARGTQDRCRCRSRACAASRRERCRARVWLVDSDKIKDYELQREGTAQIETGVGKLDTVIYTSSDTRSVSASRAPGWRRRWAIYRSGANACAAPSWNSP
jgi:phosphoribosylglycinamide formyltransferase-1